jgi:iron complex transport system permease protein
VRGQLGPTRTSPPPQLTALTRAYCGWNWQARFIRGKLGRVTEPAALADPRGLPFFQGRRTLGFGALLVAIVLVAWASLYAGKAELDHTALGDQLFGLRAQRGAVAFFAGAALALAGVITQGLFRNPLASPSILGTTSGAQLGGELMLVLVYELLDNHVPSGISHEMLTPLGCIAGALLALLVVLALAPLRASAVSLLLTGFLLSALFSSLSSLLKSLTAETWQLARALTSLSLGSVSGAGRAQLALSSMLALGSLLPAWLYFRELDVLMSGEEEASALGVDVARMRVWCVIWTAVLVAGAVAVGASVPFVGLIVPHAIRKLFGESHRALMPAAFLGGGLFLLLCDVLCRVMPLSQEVPLSVVTALVGVPVFLRILTDMERGGAT